MSVLSLLHVVDTIKLPSLLTHTHTHTPVLTQSCDNVSKSCAYKRPRLMLGSDLSVDKESSYLDLDTGCILAATRHPAQRSPSAVMTKLLVMEKCLSTLDKLVDIK